MVIWKKSFDGQLFRIPVGSGHGYFKALFAVPKWGYWIKVFPGVHKDPLPDLRTLAIQPAQFYTFFPLLQAVKQRVVASVGELPIQDDERHLPVMKEPGGVMPDGTVTDWFIIDGPSAFRVKHLSEEQKRLQDKMVVNDTALADMIAEGWRPETSIQVLKSR